ncbi:MAG TPA: type III-B CRISPR module RAMP protein Cmr4 [Anaerolineae bacterium]|nr:type III-B CRISPR module RAMP protein Cmr4 [Anaerolineae bacterium]
MFEAACLLHIYVETPLHAGTGRGLGAVDLPIQRERVTGYPIVQASSVKGRLRADCAVRSGDASKIKAVFGPEPGEGASEHAGAFSPGDARILLFPVRSLAGVFAWTTSVDVLARLRREAQMMGVGLSWSLPSPPAKDGVLVAEGNEVTAGDKVVLEEFSFSPDSSQSQTVGEIGDWFAKQALPGRLDEQGRRVSDEYDYWVEKLPKRLVILHEDAFRDFTQFATEVVTRVRLEPDTKTVVGGALWTEEHLPTDTLLYAPLAATAPRLPKGSTLPDDMKTAQDVLTFVSRTLDLRRTQLGGGETVGRGTVYLRFGEVQSLKEERNDA